MRVLPVIGREMRVAQPMRHRHRCNASVIERRQRPGQSRRCLPMAALPSVAVNGIPARPAREATADQTTPIAGARDRAQHGKAISHKKSGGAPAPAACFRSLAWLDGENYFFMNLRRFFVLV
jgi:hypothetical protein